jgi:hypothetical protein
MTRTAVHNAGDPAQVREAERKQKLASLNADAEWKGLLADPAFRRRMRQVLDWCGPMRNAFDRDALVMAFRTGEQNIGNQLIAALEAADPAAFATLLRDAHTEQTNA